MSSNSRPVCFVVYQAIDTFIREQQLAQVAGLEMKSNLNPHVI
jgi:hypothetical protein